MDTPAPPRSSRSVFVSPPRAPRPRDAPLRAALRAARRLIVLAIVACAACAGCGRSSDASRAAAPPAEETAAAATGGAAREGAGAPRRALLEVHASFTIDAPPSEARHVADRLDALAREHGGFVASSSADGDSVHVELRVPPDAIGAVRAILAGEGTIGSESRTAVDVTAAVTDLDARARAAHQEEARLLKLLDEKTASLGDVLAAEKALADVREKIERLDAERRVAHERVDLATVDVLVRAPASVTPAVDRIASAARDGVLGARDASIAMAVLALRVAPTTLVLLFAAWLLFVAARRIARRVPRDRVAFRR